MAKRKQAVLILGILVLSSLVGACKASGKPAQPGASPILVGPRDARVSGRQ